MEFIDYTKKSSDKNSVWHHFLRTTDGQKAKCKHCHNILKISGSTSTLHTHLHKKHSINVKCNEGVSTNARQEDTPIASTSKSCDPPAKKLKMTDYYESKDSLTSVISRMVVLDGLPLKVFCTSADLRKLMQKNFKENVPKSPNSIKKMIMDMCHKEKSTLNVEIKVMKSKNTKWSITLDEWTSMKSHRYLNLNIHFQNDDGENFCENLGLIRIVGSMGAEACASLIDKRLDSFGICLDKDIIGLTTDGAAVMAKLGRILPVPFHQLCLAHGVQLAVQDVLYKNNLQTHEDAESCSDSGSDEQNSDDDGFVIERSRRRGVLTDEYKKIMKKVRSVVKIFKNSPTKNDATLQKYVQAEFGKELQLLLDCKTRWSSLSIMLERFLKLKSCVQKALIDVKSAITFSDIEMLCLENLHTCLDMIKTTVEVLCRRDATILTADTAFKFLIKSLDSQDTISAKQLANSLKTRIKERRLYTVVGALQYLHNPNQFLNVTEENEDTFKKPTYEEIKNVFYQAASTITVDDCTTTSMNMNRIESLCESSSDPSPLSFKEKLNRQLSLASVGSDHHHQSTSVINATDLPSMIHVEMALFENGGGRGEILKKALNGLLSIPPTSVESERAFSTAGMFCNKIRSRLNDETLDAFMFLRSRFLKKTD